MLAYRNLQHKWISQHDAEFGERIRELRKSKNLGQRALAEKIEVSHTYVSKIENEKLDFGDYPSEDLIRKIAKALDADVDELLMLARKSPSRSRIVFWNAQMPSARSPNLTTKPSTSY